IVVNGTQADPVLFTRNTNKEWKQLKISATKRSTIKFSIFEYGGIDSEAMVFAEKQMSLFENCIFQKSESIGLKVSNDIVDMKIMESSFLNNRGEGLSVQSSTSIEISRCTFKGNKTPHPAIEKLNEIYLKEWEYKMENFPEEATFLGYKGEIYNKHLTNWSLAAVQERYRHNLQVLKQVETLIQQSGDSLKGNDLINAKLFHRDIKRN